MLIVLQFNNLLKVFHLLVQWTLVKFNSFVTLIFNQKTVQDVDLQQLVNHVGFEVAAVHWSLQLLESRQLQKLVTQWRAFHECHKLVGVIFIQKFIY